MTVSPAQAQPPVLQRQKSRKESVASMAWQGLKARIVVNFEIQFNVILILTTSLDSTK